MGACKSDEMSRHPTDNTRKDPQASGRRDRARTRAPGNFRNYSRSCNRLDGKPRHARGLPSARRPESETRNHAGHCSSLVCITHHIRQGCGRGESWSSVHACCWGSECRAGGSSSRSTRRARPPWRAAAAAVAGRLPLRPLWMTRAAYRVQGPGQVGCAAGRVPATWGWRRLQATCLASSRHDCAVVGGRAAPAVVRVVVRVAVVVAVVLGLHGRRVRRHDTRENPQASGGRDRELARRLRATSVTTLDRVTDWMGSHGTPEAYHPQTYHLHINIHSPPHSTPL